MAVGARGVLTARHVVAQAVVGYRRGRLLARVVRRGKPLSSWVAVRVVEDDPDWDLAVLEVDPTGPGAEAWVVPNSSSPAVAEVGAAVENGCEAVGFPDEDVQRGEGRGPADAVRQTEQVSGSLLPMGQAKPPERLRHPLPQQWMPLDVSGSTPTGQVGWGGMSGAGVLLPDGRLIGVVVAAEAARQQRRLYVVPLATAVTGSPRLNRALEAVIGAPIVVGPRHPVAGPVAGWGGVRHPWMVPQRAGRVVPRPEEMAALLAAVTAPDVGAVGVTTGLEGAGGFGKTTLAVEVARSAKVGARFPGGVLWVTVGEGLAGAGLAGLVGGLCRVLSGGAVTDSDPMMAGALLGGLLDEREPVLLVVDDVWRAEQLAPFLVGGRTCRRLVTTRNAGVVPRDSRTVLVDEMTGEEATRTLTMGLDADAAVVAGLLRWTGRWPVLLGLVNAALADLIVDRGAPVAEAVGWVEDRLAAAGPVAFDDPGAVTDPQARAGAVRATVEASVGLLADADRERYADLAVFPEDVDVPADVLNLLWRAGGLDTESADRLQRRLEALRLVTGRWFSQGSGGEPAVRLHDVLRSYLRHKLGRDGLAAANRRLVEAARVSLLPDTGGAQPPGWWELPGGVAGDYFWRHVPYHLTEADLDGEAAATVCDLRWVEAKTSRFASTVGVEADLARLDTAVGRTLRRAVGQNAQLLIPLDPPGSLAATLASRLTGIPDLEKVVAAYRPFLPHPRMEACWPLPDLPDPALQRLLTGHTNSVNAVVFSPDGTRLASASADGTVRLWDVETGTSRALTGHTDWVRAVVFSPDGTRLASASDDGTVRLWDVETGASRALTGHTDWVRAVVFSPDGTRLASASDDGTVRLWDVETGASRALTGHTDWLNAVAFSPDGTRLASASDDGTVRLWDVETGASRALTGHTDRVYAVAFSPDGTRLASASLDHTVRLWDVETGASRALTGHTDSVYAVAFSPDGTRLASASLDHTVRLWDVETGASRALTGHTNWLNAVAFSPDGTRLASASADHTVRLWDVETGASRALTGHTNSVGAVVFSPDGTRLASASDDGTVRLWDVETGASRALTGHTNLVNAVAFSPDGTRLASASDDGTVRLWDVETGASRALTGHTNLVNAVAFSPDGTRLASASDDGTVRLWDVETGASRALTGHTNLVNAVAFSPDGTRLASASADGTVRLWDVETGASRALTGHTDRVRAVVFSPDGTRLASASDDGTVRLWDVETGTSRALTGRFDRVRAVVFSPDGTRLASASYDRTVRLWDVETGTSRALTGHFDSVGAVVFSPDGTGLASASADGTVRLWDVETGASRALTGHTNLVNAVAFSPDGTRLASASADHTVRLWDAATGTCTAAIRTAGPLAACAWHPRQETVAIGGGAGVYLFAVMP